jgi:hypothetical protein
LDECAYLLSEGTSLVHCRFNATAIWREPQSTLKIAPLGLESLELTLQGEANVQDPHHALASFLENLDLPSLRECRLAWQVQPRAVNGGNTIPVSLRKFLTSVGHSLRVLSLAYLPMEDQQLIQCLGSLHSLEDITLQYPLRERVDALNPISDRVLQAFTLSSPVRPHLMKSGLLPWLQSIQFQCRPGALSSDSLISMIESRKGTNLRRVSFLTLRPSQPDLVILQRMKRWEKEGDVQVTMESVEL